MPERLINSDTSRGNHTVLRGRLFVRTVRNIYLGPFDLLRLPLFLTNLQLEGVVRELLEVLEPHPHEDTKYIEYLYAGKGFFDDVHGKWLDKSRVIEARRLELDFFGKMVGIHQGSPQRRRRRQNHYHKMDKHR